MCGKTDRAEHYKVKMWESPSARLWFRDGQISMPDRMKLGGCKLTGLYGKFFWEKYWRYVSVESFL
jgi:hypothetical protein